MLRVVDSALPRSQASSATRAVAIDVAGLAKVYRLGGEKLAALQDVSLSVREGEFVSLVGPSGCGKSTLLNVIAGLVPRSSGSVRVLGNDMTGPSRSIGMMFQSPVLLPWRTNL